MLGLAVDSGQAVHVPCGGDEPARAGCEGLGGGGGGGNGGQMLIRVGASKYMV